MFRKVILTLVLVVGLTSVAYTEDVKSLEEQKEYIERTAQVMTVRMSGFLDGYKAAYGTLIDHLQNELTTVTNKIVIEKQKAEAEAKKAEEGKDKKE